MIKEDRYLVFKNKDIIRYLSTDELTTLYDLARKVSQGRDSENKPVLECVCVESDWPEYEQVWEMISRRVDREDDKKEEK